MVTSVETMRRVTVLGAGTMGQGIAQLAVRAGFQTVLFDVDAGVVERARARVFEGLEKAVQKGKLAAEDLAPAKARLSVGTEMRAAVSEADVVVEAVPEDLALKRRLFQQIGEWAPATAMLGTNTSSLPVTDIASATPACDRVVGLHFFNPPPVMPLLEVVAGERTRPEIVEAARAFGVRLGKEVIVVRDSPGFATSRLGLVIALEAMRMFEEGVASAAEIDRAMELGYGHPMGPLKLTDHVGLDVRLAIAEHLTKELGERFRPPQVLRRLVRAGKLGKKSGEGFYKYGP